MDKKEFVEYSAVYQHSELVHNTKAPIEIVPILLKLIQPKSVLDVGCGIGTWLNIFEKMGVRDFLGIDGEYVDRKQLKVAEQYFKPMDLQHPFRLDRKFDLVISLEVAEHLAADCADDFIHSLINHGDCIVFSAAIPFQGGQLHLNEQWLSYWKKKFDRFNFKFYDVLRPIVWNNNEVDVWYKQNMVMFVREGHPIENTLKNLTQTSVDIVHPHLFQFYKRQADRASLFESGNLGVKIAFLSLVKAIKNKLILR